MTSAEWWQMILDFIASMETVWSALVAVFGMLLTHVLTNRSSEKRLKSEERRWDREHFREWKVRSTVEVQKSLIQGSQRLLFLTRGDNIEEKGRELLIHSIAFHFNLIQLQMFLGEKHSLAALHAYKKLFARVYDKISLLKEKVAAGDPGAREEVKRVQSDEGVLFDNAAKELAALLTTDVWPDEAAKR